MTHRLLWDPGFDSWAALRIASQPAAILFSADGKELQRWSGMFNESEVLEAIETDNAQGLVAQSANQKEDAAGRFCRYANRFEQAQRQLDDLADGSTDQVARVADDLTFAANGLAQFSPPELAQQTSTLASTTNALRTALRASDAPADLTATLSSNAALLHRQSTESLVTPLSETCSTTLTPSQVG